MSSTNNLNSLAPDPKEVAEKLASDFVDGWNRHDMASFAELFHINASFVNVIGLLMIGREEIVQVHASAHAGPFRDSTLEMQVEDARVIVPGVLIAHVRSSLRGDSRDPGGERQTLFTFVFELRDDEWRIIAAQNTNIPAATN